jgi:uncharacterized membrane protein required for colicin V production
MQSGLINKLNWVDIVVAILFLRIFFIGIKKGFIVELFKLFATVCGIFIALHFYRIISEFISSHTFITIEFADPVVLIALVVFILLIFKFIRDGLMLVFHIQPIPFIDKWGGMILSLARGLLITSLVVVFIFLVPIEYCRKSADSSFSKSYLIEVAPKTYAFIFENIYSKFSSNETLNKIIFESIQ